MATSPATGLEKWQDGIDKAIRNSRWSSLDCTIQTVVSDYNLHLSGVAGYQPLNWQFIKAMTWVESGGASPEWSSKPMQIGVHGDPGLASLLSGDEGGELILPPSWHNRLSSVSARTIPAHNIAAGVGYLLMRTANYEYRTVNDADTAIYQVTVASGDSLDRIARRNGTTVDTLQGLNPTARILQPGQVLRYQKASIRRVISGWRTITTTMIAQRYNGGGDPNYASKLDYALSAIRKGAPVACEV